MADDEYIHLYESNRRVDVQIFSEIDGTFPDWRKVVPTKASGETTQGLDHKLIGEFQKLITAAYGRNKAFTAIRICQNGQGPAIILQNTKDWFGVLMPMRMEASSDLPFRIHAEADNDDSEEPTIAAE